jgi:hypothetical protein
MSMANRIKLKVLGISYSQLQNNAYALIMAQENGPYRIPIVIGSAEAQSIAIKMEGITPPRPMTHDLFVSFAHAFGVTLREVFIYKFEDGIFSSELTFSDGTRQVVLDSRTSDAIAIAVRTNTPIYTTEDILHETGFLIEDNGNTGKSSSAEQEPTNEEQNFSPKLENLTIDELQKMLEMLINQENYEEAAHIKAIIDVKKGKQQDNNL